MTATITQALGALRPFILLVALLLGLLGAWLALVELLPILGQVFRPKGTAQGLAVVGAALAIIARGGA